MLLLGLEPPPPAYCGLKMLWFDVQKKLHITYRVLELFFESTDYPNGVILKNDFFLEKKGNRKTFH